MFLPSQTLKELIFGKIPMITAGKPVEEAQIQPSSLDCRLSDHAYNMTTSMVPKRGESVKELIGKYCNYDFRIRPDSVLLPNNCYIIPLREQLALSENFSAVFSPKSSIGRTDVFVRVLSDGNPYYDIVPAGYKGSLYAEVLPLSFQVGIAPDLALTQLRIRVGNTMLSTEELEIAHRAHGLVYASDGSVIAEPHIENGGLYFHVDMERDIVGFEAKSGVEKLDLSRKGHYDAEKFWHSLKKPQNGEMVLMPGHFYLLASRERVKIPAEYAAEIVAYDASSGEFRTHYAGFFDPGFGGECGTNVVLEVRAHNAPFRIYDGQPICKMVFEKMKGIPEKLYGSGIGSNYTGTGPSLSKHFNKKIAW